MLLQELRIAKYPKKDTNFSLFSPLAVSMCYGILKLCFIKVMESNGLPQNHQPQTRPKTTILMGGKASNSMPGKRFFDVLLPRRPTHKKSRFLKFKRESHQLLLFPFKVVLFMGTSLSKMYFTTELYDTSFAILFGLIKALHLHYAQVSAGHGSMNV